MYGLPPLRDKQFSGGASIKHLYYCDEEQLFPDRFIIGKNALGKLNNISTIIS